jgi:hypothetical protein
MRFEHPAGRLGVMSTATSPNRPTRSWTTLADGYLTDGQQLLRVVSRFDPCKSDVFALLEDCATLEVKAYSPRELAEMGLRRVAGPAGSDTARAQFIEGWRILHEEATRTAPTGNDVCGG